MKKLFVLISLSLLIASCVTSINTGTGICMDLDSEQCYIKVNEIKEKYQIGQNMYCGATNYSEVGKPIFAAIIKAHTEYVDDYGYKHFGMEIEDKEKNSVFVPYEYISKENIFENQCITFDEYNRELSDFEQRLKKADYWELTDIYSELFINKSYSHIDYIDKSGVNKIQKAKIKKMIPQDLANDDLFFKCVLNYESSGIQWNHHVGFEYKDNSDECILYRRNKNFNGVPLYYINGFDYKRFVPSLNSDEDMVRLYSLKIYVNRVKIRDCYNDRYYDGQVPTSEERKQCEQKQIDFFNDCAENGLYYCKRTYPSEWEKYKKCVGWGDSECGAAFYPLFDIGDVSI